jgi:hypothetical protein
MVMGHAGVADKLGAEIPTGFDFGSCKNRERAYYRAYRMASNTNA